MANTLQELKGKHSPEYFRSVFVRRSHDHAFQTAAALIDPTYYEDQRWRFLNIDGDSEEIAHEKAIIAQTWYGFELLTDSLYIGCD